MACLSPLIAINAINKDGVVAPKVLGKLKNQCQLKYLRDTYGEGLIFLPCGKCINCAKDKARIWQARLMCESIYHPANYFITLTYASRPPEKPLKSHLREFIKGLRNSLGSGIKFFACGECGEKNHRSHYHLIVFLHEPLNDLQVFSKRGLNFTYTSKFLSSIWKRGFVNVGELDVESAGYVAKYSQKKRLDGLDNDTSWIIMSRGLGLQYVRDNYKQLLRSDYIYIRGNKFKLPRYFLDKLLEYNSDVVLAYKARKQKVATTFRFNEGYSTNENNARIMKTEIIEAKARKEVLQRELD